MLEHTDGREQHPADQAMVTFHFTDDVFLRPYN